MPLDFSGRPGRPRSSAERFVDRTADAEAFSLALRQHRVRMDSGRIDGRQLNHVLTFYGMGGVGKTALSLRLSDWVQGRLPTDVGWGPPPSTRPDVVVRWDFSSSHGAVDPVTMLLHLRRGLGVVKRVWPVFDLPFAALTRVMRPGQTIRLDAGPRDAPLLLADVASELLTDAAAGADVAGAAGGASLGVGAGRLLLSRAMSSSRANSAYRSNEGLQQLTADCERHDGSDAATAELCIRILEQLSSYMDRMTPGDRPLVVVFVDAVERLQRTGADSGEAVLNYMVASLPYCLFVMTGRNALRWHEPHPQLPVQGPHHWPGLRLEEPPLDEPRQHRVGNLAQRDAVEFLAAGLAAAGVRFSPELPEALFDETNGWPLHMETLIEVARNRLAVRQEVGPPDLQGSFPTLVARLCQDLPGDEATAFRAACLLPYFDCVLAAEAAGVTVAAVERLVQRPIVIRGGGSHYPYRIHDDLRRTVRRTGSEVPGGWSESDWLAHAYRALRVAQRRFAGCMADVDDRGAVLSLALALNVCAENGVYDSWVLGALRDSPTLRGLSVLIPPGLPTAGHPDVSAVIDFVHAMSLGVNTAALEALEQISRRPVAVASTAALWRLYHLRALGRFDDATAQALDLRARFSDRTRLYRTQHAVTLYMARRHKDAVRLAADLDERTTRRISSLVDAAEGYHLDQVGYRWERVQEVDSRRYQVELLGYWLFTKHIQYGVSDEEVDAVQVQADEVDHYDCSLICRAVRGQEHIREVSLVDRLQVEMAELDALRGRPSWMTALLLAVRSLATSDREYAAQAAAMADLLPSRPSTWIRVEVLLDHLGLPVRLPEAQLTRPRAEVAERWLALLSAVADGRRLLRPETAVEYLPPDRS